MERIFLSVAVSGLSGVDTSFLYLSVPDGQFQKACGIYESMGTAGLLFSFLVFTLFLKDNYRGAGFFTVLTYGAAFVLSLFLSRLSGGCQPFDKFSRRLRSLPGGISAVSFLV